MDLSSAPRSKIRLTDINSYLTCHLCKGYLIDATTISECLHSFCRSCIIKFLQENSYCPICEVIINKAKPNIKLDKTLQDIVYKLVPELFINEMQRRQKFYLNHPELAAKCTPEERGEDTERTIFNPKDVISLSIEYASDDVSPQRGVLTPATNNIDGAYRTRTNTTKAENEKEAPMRRFLQCPGMCRIDVLKKFVRNKYNVDTNKFHIDILYKRVPLPDHHTLIDIAYIYSWKRNEPMKFFFRIVDKNLANEPFDVLSLAKPIIQRPQKQRIERKSLQKIEKERKSPSRSVFKVPEPKTPPSSHHHNLNSPSINTESENEENEKKKSPTRKIEKEKSDKDEKESTTKHEFINTKNEDDIKDVKIKIKSDKDDFKSTHKKEEDNKKSVDEKSDKKCVNGVIKKSEDKKVYTNITLKRSDNLEIITKIQKVSNKNGQMGLNIIKQTVKKYPPNTDPILKSDEDDKEFYEEKIQFMKMLNLTVKCEEVEETKKVAKEFQLPPDVNTLTKIIKLAKSKKRKQASPKHTEGVKMSRLHKEIPPNVTMYSKVMPKESQQPTIQKGDLQNLFSNCKLNIPSSLSITLKENGGDFEEEPQPPVIKPVKNYIEILKLPEVQSSLKVNTNSNQDDKEEMKLDDEVPVPDNVNVQVKKEEPMKECGKNDDHGDQNDKTKDSKKEIRPLHVKVPHIPCKVMPTIPIKESSNLTKLNPRSAQTFQKMFEEACKKHQQSQSSLDNKKVQKNALDLTTENQSPQVHVQSHQNGTKRKLNDIASELIKKTKKNQEESMVNGSSPLQQTASSGGGKLPLPRLNNHNHSHNHNQRKNNRKSPVAILPNVKELSPNSKARFQQQLVANLRSPSLGMNYSVSVSSSSTPNQDGQKITSPTLNIPNPRQQQQHQQITTNVGEDLKGSKNEQSGRSKDEKRDDLSPLSVLNGLVASQGVGKDSAKAAGGNADAMRQMSNQLLFNNFQKMLGAHSPRPYGSGYEFMPPIRLPTSPLNQGSKNSSSIPFTSNNFGQTSSLSQKSQHQNQSQSQISPRSSSSSSSNGNKLFSTPKSTKGAPRTSHLPQQVVMSSQLSALPPQRLVSPRTSTSSPKPSPYNAISPKPGFPNPLSSPRTLTSPKTPKSSSSPKSSSPSTSNIMNGSKIVNSADKKKDNGSASASSPSPSASSTSTQAQNPEFTNQLMEKYNIQNLAQLTASFNINPAALGMPHPMTSPTQMAFQQAMIYRHFEMQNRQNWLNMNPNPMAQYEKFLQSLNQSQSNQLLGKEN